MNKTGKYLFVVLLVGATLLAACGQAAVINGNPAAPAAAPIATAIPQSTVANSIPVNANNCTLVTNDDVAKVLGEAVVDARDPSKKGINCVYQTKNLILELNTLHAFGGFANSVEYMKQTRVDGVGEPALDVPGLGDEAFYHGGAAYRLLLVRKGDTVYSFGVRNVTADQSLSSPDNAQVFEKAIAELLLSRLP
jgi:hypothetical protein